MPSENESKSNGAVGRGESANNWLPRPRNETFDMAKSVFSSLDSTDWVLSIPRATLSIRNSIDMHTGNTLLFFPRPWLLSSNQITRSNSQPIANRLYIYFRIDFVGCETVCWPSDGDKSFSQRGTTVKEKCCNLYVNRPNSMKNRVNENNRHYNTGKETTQSKSVLIPSITSSCLFMSWGFLTSSKKYILWLILIREIIR